MRYAEYFMIDFRARRGECQWSDYRWLQPYTAHYADQNLSRSLQGS